MNERIRELAVKANLEIDPAHPDHNQKVLEKFAELIVRECALVVHKKTGPKSALNVLEHFGIEQ